MLEMYIGYRRAAEKKPSPEPKRIIFYRGPSTLNRFVGVGTDWPGVVDGVSEGEFQQVIDLGMYRIVLLHSLLTTASVTELPRLRSKLLVIVYPRRPNSFAEACQNLKINPKITLLITGKRHHVRFFPQQKDADRSGNCPAGTVVDEEIVNPIEFDWYLQSHAG